MGPNFGIATGAYVEERDDWAAAVGRAERERWRFIELTALGDTRLDGLPALVERDALRSFERVSLHAPTRGAEPPELVERVLQVPLDVDVVLHPDVYTGVDAVDRLGARAVFENMDVAKAFGRGLADLRATFERHPNAGFCLDVAHVWTNDTSLHLGHDLLDAFGDRLRQLHVSGIEPDGTHRETTRDDLELYEPLLARCPGVPWLLESIPVSGGGYARSGSGAPKLAVRPPFSAT